MTIVVEIGDASLASANSYISAASCAEYLNSKGLTTWGVSTATVQEVSLINACMWMELLPWRGYKTLQTDPLAWPRSSIIDRDGYIVYSDTIPRDVKRAQCEFAYRSYLGKSPFSDVSSGDGYITREKIGPVEIDYKMGYSTSYKFPEIDKLLEPFIFSSLSIEIERS